MQKTSLSAYQWIKPKLNKMEKLILETLKVYGDMTNFEISVVVDKPVNEITGRTNSLVKKRLVSQCGEKKNERTGKMNILWSANYKEELF